jgi:hypothetical protein
MENSEEKPKIGFFGLLLIFCAGITAIILIAKYVINVLLK